jgi:hypothetical protein
MKKIIFLMILSISYSLQLMTRCIQGHIGCIKDGKEIWGYPSFCYDKPLVPFYCYTNTESVNNGIGGTPWKQMADNCKRDGGELKITKECSYKL